MYTAVYGPYRLVYTAVYGPCARPFSAVDTGRVHCRLRPSTYRVHGRVTARVVGRVQGPSGPCIRQAGLPGRVHVLRRHATAVGRVQGRNGPCTRSCTRPMHSRVHVRLRTRTVCRNGPHAAVACRLGTCTWPGRPTCHVHDGPCTRPCTWPVYTAVYWPCTRPCIWRVHGLVTAVYTYACVPGCVHGRERAVYTAAYGPCRTV